MNKEEFLQSMKNHSKPDNSWHRTLQSLWWDKKGNWDLAHSIAQNIPSTEGSAIHAYLHRKEGVLWNADYWYNLAGRKRSDLSFDEEWSGLVSEMLEKFDQ